MLVEKSKILLKPYVCVCVTLKLLLVWEPNSFIEVKLILLSLSCTFRRASLAKFHEVKHNIVCMDLDEEAGLLLTVGMYALRFQVWSLCIFHNFLQSSHNSCHILWTCVTHNYSVVCTKITSILDVGTDWFPALAIILA